MSLSSVQVRKQAEWGEKLYIERSAELSWNEGETL